MEENKRQQRAAVFAKKQADAGADFDVLRVRVPAVAVRLKDLSDELEALVAPGKVSDMRAAVQRASINLQSLIAQHSVDAYEAGAVTGSGAQQVYATQVSAQARAELGKAVKAIARELVRAGDRSRPPSLAPKVLDHLRLRKDLPQISVNGIVRILRANALEIGIPKHGNRKGGA